MTPKELADRIEAAMLESLKEQQAEVVFSHLLPDAKAIATAASSTHRYCAFINLSSGAIELGEFPIVEWESVQSEIEVGGVLKWLGSSEDGDFALYLHDQILKSKML
jgi:hypothetical protein